MKRFFMFVLALSILQGFSCRSHNQEEQGALPDAEVVSCLINDVVVESGGRIAGVDPGYLLIILKFSRKVDPGQLYPLHIYMDNGVDADFQVHYGQDHKTLVIRVDPKLDYYTLYTLYVEKGPTLGVNLTSTYEYQILTSVDPSPKFPKISDEELLTLVQMRTFQYFWDYAHPVSGLARERLGSGDVVTIGGSGFGIMSLPIAVARGFVTRSEAASRLLKNVNFLNNQAERFHGAFPHWLDGGTGKAIPFSSEDNGGDIVETALLIQGLLVARQFFNTSDPIEVAACKVIEKIWESVEWDWYTRGENVLYWHWSPDFGWKMNMPVNGWNEALIAYVLAASSPTHSISKEVYDGGWARLGKMANGKKFYDILLPLGPDYGGPLFFAHYSFLGLDPRQLSDEYADYWEQNRNHTRINHRYCVRNPKRWYGYGEDVWGLTASDIPDGYAASSPTDDRGVIAPTAALSSMPYTPEESMRALRYYYYILGDRAFGEYGFCDAFSLQEQWFDPSYLAIDQGPAIIMMENYRSGLVWDLFMKNVCILDGLEKLGFEYVK